ncbi:MarR family transcriptional regulator [Nonomuraea sp. 3-1Str]|uniref:MarR family winged helix-turn-helix transcriptional regulator n=1 Tax=Nonomuraea sp. 3-1Str TaxID=2929801 RepID=UPI00285A06DA|nr:MarR family transcriptional regulator [Nonomuraea sp. 3-1Str]MDR8410085.1 MarR family transcriptional regulator [Nonomuraea sp. 3-1Str]
MEQVSLDLDRSIGYQLKRAHAALRAAMDAALRRHGLTTPQYACLELLDQRPGLSNAELARGAFVTRQSMNVVLRNLQDAGLVERPEAAPHGRALPATLTETGGARLLAARADVLDVERLMVRDLDPARTDLLVDALTGMAAALGESEPPAG